MKKQLLLATLLIFPSLLFLANKNDLGNQNIEISRETLLVSHSNWLKSTENKWSQEPENRTGRSLTYFWEEQGTQL